MNRWPTEPVAPRTPGSKRELAEHCSLGIQVEVTPGQSGGTNRTSFPGIVSP